MVFYSVETILTSMFMIAVSLVAVLGNFLVILAILWNRKLRTVCNFLFLNLAVADMLQGAIAMPLRLADQLNQTDNSPLVPCLVVIPLTVFLFGASNFNLTLISLDRYIALRRPFIYPILAEPRRAAFIIAMSWVLISIIAFLPLMGWGAADSLDVADICLYSTTLSREYLFMLFSIVNLSVILILSFTNYFILKTARNQIRRIKVNEGPAAGSTVNWRSSVPMETESVIIVRTLQSITEGSTIDRDPARTPARTLKSKERRATKIVLIVVGIFVFLTTPITVIDIISLLGCPACTPLTLVKITVFMAYANACVNVFIYAGFNTEMRNTWASIFRSIKQAILTRFSGVEAS